MLAMELLADNEFIPKNQNINIRTSNDVIKEITINLFNDN